MAANNGSGNYTSCDTAPAAMLGAMTPRDANDLEWVTNAIIAKGAGDLSIIALWDTDPVTVQMSPAIRCRSAPRASHPSARPRQASSP